MRFYTKRTMFSMFVAMIPERAIFKARPEVTFASRSNSKTVPEEPE